METWFDPQLKSLTRDPKPAAFSLKNAAMVALTPVDTAAVAARGAARPTVVEIAHPSSLRDLDLALVFLPENKENIDPSNPVFGRPASRSPLPSWYPRLPLQDITAKLNAEEVQVLQVDGGKKGSKKLKVTDCSVASPIVAAPSKATSGSCYIKQRAKQRDGRPLRRFSSCTSTRGATLRKDFR